MHRAIAPLASTACTGALAVATVPSALAGDVGPADDLTGRWQSATVKMDRLGWALTLRPAAGGSGYAAVFQFRDQDGSPGARVRTRITADGTRTVLAWSKGPPR